MFVFTDADSRHYKLYRISIIRHSVQPPFGSGSPLKGKSGVIPVLAIILSRYWRTSAGNRSPKATPSMPIKESASRILEEKSGRRSAFDGVIRADTEVGRLLKKGHDNLSV